ncbi:MAG: DUF6265 family protein [Gemmatimonadetes bacterium]|nr:DUF6265 family protein [Gemmatimonadota bacterium]MDA1104914.1 DUF6265 family protein [Gemmatimonadota bacterium]
MKSLIWILAVGFAVGPKPAAGQTPFTLADISFLRGCWTGDMGSLDMLEQWSDPDGGVMLGSTRYLRDGRVVDWEFGMFLETESGVTLWPYPKGERSPNGFPLVSTNGEYVFENLNHDFPVRIIYARAGDEALNPRIEGRDGKARGWSLQRAPCTDGPATTPTGGY